MFLKLQSPVLMCFTTLHSPPAREAQSTNPSMHSNLLFDKLLWVLSICQASGFYILVAMEVIRTAEFNYLDG